MTTKKQANLVIIGSGPAGMIAALRFKKLFEKVILLERQSKDSFLESHGL